MSFILSIPMTVGFVVELCKPSQTARHLDNQELLQEV